VTEMWRLMNADVVLVDGRCRSWSIFRITLYSYKQIVYHASVSDQIMFMLVQFRIMNLKVEEQH